MLGGEPRKAKGSREAPLTSDSLSGSGHPVSRSHVAYVPVRGSFFKIAASCWRRHPSQQQRKDLVELRLRKARNFPFEL